MSSQNWIVTEAERTEDFGPCKLKLNYASIFLALSQLATFSPANMRLAIGPRASLRAPRNAPKDERYPYIVPFKGGQCDTVVEVVELSSVIDPEINKCGSANHYIVLIFRRSSDYIEVIDTTGYFCFASTQKQADERRERLGFMIEEQMTQLFEPDSDINAGDYWGHAHKIPPLDWELPGWIRIVVNGEYCIGKYEKPTIGCSGVACLTYVQLLSQGHRLGGAYFRGWSMKQSADEDRPAESPVQTDKGRKCKKSKKVLEKEPMKFETDPYRAYGWVLYDLPDTRIRHYAMHMTHEGSRPLFFGAMETYWDEFFDRLAHEGRLRDKGEDLPTLVPCPVRSIPEPGF